jgi:hypothetical protein
MRESVKRVLALLGTIAALTLAAWLATGCRTIAGLWIPDYADYHCAPDSTGWYCTYVDSTEAP